MTQLTLPYTTAEEEQFYSWSVFEEKARKIAEGRSACLRDAIVSASERVSKGEIGYINHRHRERKDSNLTWSLVGYVEVRGNRPRFDAATCRTCPDCRSELKDVKP